MELFKIKSMDQTLHINNFKWRNGRCKDVKSLTKARLLVNEISETIKNKTKVQKGGLLAVKIISV